MQEMIHKGIPDRVYLKTEDSTIQDLKQFHDFLYGNFSKYEKYNDMLPISNEPAQLYGTVKSPKFDVMSSHYLQTLQFMTP